jgi:hypothetical protein
LSFEFESAHRPADHRYDLLHLMEPQRDDRDEAEERKRNEISLWLANACGMDPEKAVHVQKEFVEGFYFRTVRAIQEMLAQTPNLLASLKLPPPTRLLLEAKINAYNTKKLERLSSHDMENLLNGFYIGECYGTKIVGHKVNGFVLATAGSVERLHQWGVTDPNHVEDLWQRVVHWKKYGVPMDFLVIEFNDEVGNQPSVSTVVS